MSTFHCETGLYRPRSSFLVLLYILGFIVVYEGIQLDQDRPFTTYFYGREKLQV